MLHIYHFTLHAFKVALVGSQDGGGKMYLDVSCLNRQPLTPQQPSRPHSLMHFNTSLSITAPLIAEPHRVSNSLVLLNTSQSIQQPYTPQPLT